MLRTARTTFSFTEEGKRLIEAEAARQGISQAVYIELLVRKDAEAKAAKRLKMEKGQAS